MRRMYILLMLIFALSAITAHAGGKVPLGRSPKAVSAEIKNTRQGFSMKLWLSNDLIAGKRAAPRSSENSCNPEAIGMEYPVNSCIEHLFGGGPMIGGIINGVRLVSSAYNTKSDLGDFAPNPNDTFANRFWFTSISDTGLDVSRKGFYKRAMNIRCFDDDGDGLVDEDDLDGADNDLDWVEADDDLGSDGISDEAETGCKGGFDPVLNPDPAFDNYEPTKQDLCRPDGLGNYPFKSDYRLYTEGNHRADHGEPHVDEDFAAKSDNDIYVSATDTNIVDTTRLPMRVKIIQKSYAWDNNKFHGALPIEYYFINMGDKIIRDVYIGFSEDPDVGKATQSGFASNNYAGYNEEYHTAFVHNPLASGVGAFGLTMVRMPGTTDTIQRVFQWHGFDPPCGVTRDSLVYNCISCEAFSSVCTKPDQSIHATNDTRFVLSFGPYKELRPGDTLGMTIAYVSGDDSYDGIRDMLTNGAIVRGVGSLIDYGFALKPPPPSPPLQLKQEGNSVVVDWSCKLGGREVCPIDVRDWVQYQPCSSLRPRAVKQGSETTGDAPKIFEAYRLYRSESSEFDKNSFRLIAEYDVEGNEFFYNVGIESTYVDSNLRVGKEYWYAVTSVRKPETYIIQVPGPGGNPELDTVTNPGEESKIADNAKKIYIRYAAATRLGEVKVVPNPYWGNEQYSGEHGFEGSTADWNAGKRKVKFIHLPEKATVRVYTIAGEVVHTLYHDDATSGKPGEADFPLFSEEGKQLAPGVFVFSVESIWGTQIGKFVVIK